MTYTIRNILVDGLKHKKGCSYVSLVELTVGHGMNPDMVKVAFCPLCGEELEQDKLSVGESVERKKPVRRKW
jgi:hypothetical protein